MKNTRTSFVLSLLVALASLVAVVSTMTHLEEWGWIESFVMLAFAVFALLIGLAAVWASLEDPPSDEHEEEGEPTDETPLCTTCLTPVRPLTHYCPNCGETVGEYTRYIPFVDIPFRYNFFGRVWAKAIRTPGVRLHTRVGHLLLLIALAPEMFIGLPFLLWRRARRKASNP